MKKNQLNNNGTKIKCTGLNLVKFVNECVNHNIELQGLKRLKNDEVEFYLTDSDLNKFNSLNLSNYNIEIEKFGGIRKILSFLLLRIGLIIGLVASIVLLILCNNRLLHIEIIGLTSLSEEEVEKSINDYGINKFSSLNVNISELENYLTETFNLSLVSIITKGNTMIVSIKEELPELSEDYTAIIANYDMVINSITVYSGTAKVKSGDIVYKGDILVEPYYLDGENKIEIKPCAEIIGDTFFNASYSFYREEDVLIRTGKKKIIESTYMLGNTKIFSSFSENNFLEYEEEESEKNISNYFLPIKVKNKVIYELASTTITRNFDDEKENIISQLKTEAYNKVPNVLVVDEEKLNIVETTFGNIVTLYLKCEVVQKVV